MVKNNLNFFTNKANNIIEVIKMNDKNKFKDYEKSHKNNNDRNGYNWHSDELNTDLEIADLNEKVNKTGYYGGYKTKRLVEIGEELLANKDKNNRK